SPASPSKIAITVNGGTMPTAGFAFPVALEAQDAYGNASAVGADTAVALSRAAGTGTLGGTTTGTISAGQSGLTLSGVNYSKAEAGVRLAAARTSGDSL